MQEDPRELAARRRRVRRCRSAAERQDRAATRSRAIASRTLEQELATAEAQARGAGGGRGRQGEAARRSSAPGTDGFFLRSPDEKSFQIRFRGYTQFDARCFTDGRRRRHRHVHLPARAPDRRGHARRRASTSASCRTSRTARSSLQDAYVNLRYLPEAPAPGRASSRRRSGSSGSSRPPRMMFIERALPTLLVPNRDLGVMVHGRSAAKGWSSYQLAPDERRHATAARATTSTPTTARTWSARIFVQPFQDSTPGVARGPRPRLRRRATATQNGGAPASYRSPGPGDLLLLPRRRRADASPATARIRYSPQVYYYWGPFGAARRVRARRTRDVTLRAGSDGATLDNDAWQIAAQLRADRRERVVQGRRAARGRSTPDEGGWGACEIAGRYHELHVDEDVVRPSASPIRLASAENAKAWARRRQLVPEPLGQDHARLRPHGFRRRRAAGRRRPTATPRASCSCAGSSATSEREMQILQRKIDALRLDRAARHRAARRRARRRGARRRDAAQRLLRPDARALRGRTTRSSPSTGRRRRARPSRSTSRTAARASRRAP